MSSRTSACRSARPVSSARSSPTRCSRAPSSAPRRAGRTRPRSSPADPRHDPQPSQQGIGQTMTNDQKAFREVTAAEAVALSRDGYRVIDVREPGEWDAGHIPGATLLPLADLPQRIGEVQPDKDAPLLLHCAVGGRSARAAAWLTQMGYTNVVSMKAPVSHWKEQGGPWEEPAQLLTPAQMRRYSRHVLIPEVGQEGQRKLLDAKVLLIGAGGLGSPIGLYLAASGVGTIGFVDDDVV